MTKHILFLFFAFYNIVAISQDIVIQPYSENLNEYADAIVLSSSTDITLLNQGQFTSHRKKLILIKNKQADYLADVQLSYDNNSSYKKIKINYYTEYGKLIHKVRKKEIKDVSATGYATMYSDDRALIYKNTATEYPYIVYIEYTYKSENTAFLPQWHPVPNYNVSVVKSRYSFIYPEGFTVRKQKINFKKFNVVENETPVKLNYKINNVSALDYEELSPRFSDLSVKLRLALNKFKLAGILGEVNSWDEFGKWMYNDLLKGRATLFEQERSKIKALVKGINDPIERAKIIYDFVQNKTRYINVAIGIGGWQPMKASDVHELGYGDCKALTFYTQTLMKIADVNAIYTVIYAGDKKSDIDKDFVGIQGNHVLLCLPQQKDSIWLECTSQKMPFGYVNSFTDDRDALLITTNGAKIVHTNTLKSTQNLQQTTAEYTIDSEGNINANIEIKSYGTQYKNHLFRHDGLSPKDLKEKLMRYFDAIISPEISNIKVNNDKKNKLYKENLALEAQKYAQKNENNALIFSPNAFNRLSYVPSRILNRKTPFIIPRGYKDEDIYTIHIPKNYTLKLPKNTTIKNQFGSYSLVYQKINENSFIYHRTFVLNKGTYNKELYKDYRKFRKKIKRLEKQRILIQKR